jgi:hypothetical protein
MPVLINPAVAAVHEPAFFGREEGVGGSGKMYQGVAKGEVLLALRQGGDGGVSRRRRLGRYWPEKEEQKEDAEGHRFTYK